MRPWPSDRLRRMQVKVCATSPCKQSNCVKLQGRHAARGSGGNIKTRATSATGRKMLLHRCRWKCTIPPSLPFPSSATKRVRIMTIRRQTHRPDQFHRFAAALHRPGSGHKLALLHLLTSNPDVFKSRERTVASPYHIMAMAVHDSSCAECAVLVITSSVFLCSCSMVQNEPGLLVDVELSSSDLAACIAGVILLMPRSADLLIGVERAG